MKEKQPSECGGKECFQMEIQGIHLPNRQTGLMPLNIKKSNNLIEKWAKDLSGHLSREGIQVAIKHLKRCSASLITREIQIRGSVRDHFRPGQPGLLKNLTINAGGVWGERNPPSLGGNVNQCVHGFQTFNSQQSTT